MKRGYNITTDLILKEFKMKQKYGKMNQREETIAQFQLKHCRYCKNKNTNLCEIRKDINNKLKCVYEER